MSDRIFLSGVRLPCRIGVPEEERAQPQELIADLEMAFDIRPAAASDDVHATVDYALVRDTMERVAARRPYALIETLIESMAAEILAHFPVESVRLLVRKPRALAHLGVDWPGIEIVRTRNG